MMTTALNRSAPLLTAALVVAALATTGCSSSGSTGVASSPAATSPAPTSPAASSPTGFPPTSSSPTASSSAITQAELDAALLDPGDIGHGFVLGTYRANDSGGPCEPPGTPSVDQRVPPQLSAGRTFDSRTVSAEITQNAAIYATPAEAARAFTLAVRGESCRHGTLSNGMQVTISPGQDVSAQVDGNVAGKSTAWRLSSGSIRAVIVATLSGRVANACIFVAAADVNTSRLPDPVAVAKAAFDKLLVH
jgi:hypothetical protein